jgi:hypothetical protein
MQQRAHSVYSIPCEYCRRYIDERGRLVAMQLHEHRHIQQQDYDIDQDIMNSLGKTLNEVTSEIVKKLLKQL